MIEKIEKIFYRNFNSYTKYFSYAVFFFLVMPILILVPLSFNAGSYFTFTQGMLSLDPEAFSLRWYHALFADEKWILSIKNSFYIATLSTILAVILGTIAAIGLNSPKVPFKNFLMIIVISPMIVPMIILAAGLYFFYAYTNLLDTYAGLIIAHAILGVPFVVINVLSSLSAYDDNFTKASYSLGAGKIYTFFHIMFPIIRPGVISGALFAFITSFDEIIVMMFLAGAEQRTIPRQMFSGLREQISPTILAASSLLLLFSVILLLTIQYVQKKSNDMRGIE